MQLIIKQAIPLAFPLWLTLGQVYKPPYSEYQTLTTIIQVQEKTTILGHRKLLNNS